MDEFNPQIESARPPWKIVAIIAGAVVLAVLLVVGAIWFARSREGVNVDAQNLARVEIQLERELQGCAQETDPAACRLRKVLLATQATGAASLCASLSGEEFDGCVWSVARDRMDAATCASITDEENAATCADSVNVQLALSSMDTAYCDKITDATKREGCTTTLEGPLTAGNCASRGNGQEACDQLASFEAAVASKNPDQCAALSNEEYRSRCEDLVGTGDRDLDGLNEDEEMMAGSSDTSADTDGDGLTDAEEISVYASDPAATDTDGDGFNDGDEVKNGYNPSGAGRLNE